MERAKRKRILTSKMRGYMNKVIQPSEKLQYPACVEGLDLNPLVKIEPLDYDGEQDTVYLKKKDQTSTCTDSAEKNVSDRCSYSDSNTCNRQWALPLRPNISPLEDFTSSYDEQCPIESLKLRPMENTSSIQGTPDFLLNPKKVFKVNKVMDFQVTIVVCIICNGGFLSSVELKLHKRHGCVSNPIVEPASLTTNIIAPTLPSNINTSNDFTNLSKGHTSLSNELVTLVPMETKGKSTLFKVASLLNKGNGTLSLKRKAPSDHLDSTILPTTNGPTVEPSTAIYKKNRGFSEKPELQQKENGSKEASNTVVPKPSKTTPKNVKASSPSSKQVKVRPKRSGLAASNTAKVKHNKDVSVAMVTSKSKKRIIPHTKLSKAKQMSSKKVALSNELVSVVPIETKGGSTLFKLPSVLNKGTETLKKKSQSAALDILIPPTHNSTPDWNTVKPSSAIKRMKKGKLQQQENSKGASDNVMPKPGTTKSDVDIPKNTIADHEYTQHKDKSEIEAAIENIPMFDDDPESDNGNVDYDGCPTVENSHTDKKMNKLLYKKKEKQKLEAEAVKPFLKMLETKVDENGNEQYKCGFCGYVMKLNKSHHKTPSLLKTRLKRHLICHANKIYKCELCDFDRADKAALKYHMDRTHNVEKQYTCEICSYSFQCEAYLNRHIARHKQTPSCKVCGKKYTTHKKLKAHIIYEHDGATLVPCDKCEAKFTTSTHMVKHKYKAHRCGKQLCTYCGLYFSHLKLHMTLKHGLGEEIFSCTICSYETPRRAYFKTHMMCHQGKKPYKCDLCGWECLKKERWNRHMLNKHGYAKRFHCGVCHFSTSTKQEMYTHEKVHESDEASEITSNVAAECSNPPDTSVSEPLPIFDIEREITLNVPNQNVIDVESTPVVETYYSCADCNTLHGTEEDLNAHFLTAHGTAVEMFCENQPQTVTQEIVVDTVQNDT